MKEKENAFTLVELLVVISIIAVLLGVLIPALTKARKVAMGAVCISQMKTYSIANQAYSNANDGKYVPFSQYPTKPELHTGKFGMWDERWCENSLFRKYISGDRKLVQDAWNDPYIFPPELRCPAQRITDPCAYMANFYAQNPWPMVISYAMNTERWVGASAYDAVGWMPSDHKYRGHITVRVTRPSGCMAFVESNYYMTHYDRADFRTYWDNFGDVLVATPNPNWAQVAYRHANKASAAFFDGHARLLPKNMVYNLKNKVNAFSPNDRKPEALWDSEYPLVGSVNNGIH